MGLLKPPRQLTAAEELFNEYNNRKNKNTDHWINFGLWSAAFAILVFALHMQPAVAGAFIGIWGIVRIQRSLQYIHWKKVNHDKLEEAMAFMDKKEKRAAQLAAIQDKLNNLDHEFPPAELKLHIKEQSESTIAMLTDGGLENSQLIDAINHNVSEANKIIDIINQIEVELEEQDSELLRQEKAMYVSKVASTASPEVQKQLYETIALLDQRLAQINQLDEKRKLLRAKISSFQQAIENVRLKTTTYRSEAVNKDHLSTFNGANDLTCEMQIMDKIHSELDEISFSDEKLQKDLLEMHQQRQRAAQLAANRH